MKSSKHSNRKQFSGSPFCWFRRIEFCKRRERHISRLSAGGLEVVDRCDIILMTHTHSLTHTHTHIHTHTHTHIYTHAHVHTQHTQLRYIHTHTRTVYVCCMSVRRTLILTHAHTRKHTHTHAHTHITRTSHSPSTNRRSEFTGINENSIMLLRVKSDHASFGQVHVERNVGFNL